ncbi:chondroitin sulfate proteoglycan 4 isoform X1 [Bombus affinis]|uniref:chondroitin sulfate proteoglycan 4 isoform X1 n=2 Tax=Bombus affinis TaxID=309941 RepID=UPI0021B7CD21|nr:chondroitin sulfate proteoglycan 4 isoform X1 [Bombus affinis]XP_050584237.1 chondroitin sulfate proteoglycan 4 isoform X1 [Bombus affinis]XP_050584238.1 chondroitin sulfate proteoglycan 4 isoform X1 [Bombus affinis]XP_050584239.1 chondroitin sulfate proteoglycan 4 isoform X1 [Bombus affinis]XP_050584240.1 chondroitin sulfate proteoglycan 4 isoform X1 [Bombus affinis]XP_050584241.1 chondroitin sulfate proteoglycan 4 isoform X1 [Bombus affinis]XP_050584242.1 chondroitin sulfate proteoglycan
MFLNDMELLMFLAVTASLLGYCQTDEKVSFYGASYIHLPVQEAKGATDISFRFRTHLADAMLLLAAGKTDYCLIKLEAGRLKVHINLGAGESEMASARGLTLNDLSWHEVNLTRREANITLQIDVIHTTKSLLPGRFFELNIHYGVFIGGQGDFNELFLGHTDYLRGCMADIIYNGARVIEYAKSRKGQSEATAVTWSCSPEFDATRSTEVSFVEDGAFAAIPRPIPRSGSKWEFELKTGAESGLLLYNTGQSSYADYLGIELFEGKIRLLMNKGNGPTELIHGTPVADGKWHRVAVDFNPSGIGITVDRQEKTITLPSGGNRYLDLADTLYIGGTELNKRARALGKGLKSGDVSYNGCLRNMLLDNKELGLPDVKISQGIVVGCVWGYPCIDADPCVSEAVCSQLGVSSFKCDCDQPVCIKANYAEDHKVHSRVNLPVNLEILSLRPLVLSEGEHALLTSDNIAMVLDIAKYGMEEDGVIFNLVTPPTYGTLALDLLTTRTAHSFTLQDVNRDKVQYMHDGSETTEDSMILDVRLVAGIGYTLPGYLRGRLRFPLHVNVTPVNDPPLLEISTAKVLRLAQGTRKILTKEFIWAIDADTPSDMLVYTVLRTDADAGYVERVTYPSRPIDTFTQAELMQGLIAYVHRGNAKPNAKLDLRVSDGIESSQPASLRVAAHPLEIKLMQNTGLVVVHRSYSYLTSANLSFVTNSDDNTIDIRYDIVSQPQFGTIQKLKDVSSSWMNVDRFTSRDIELHTIRYLHNEGSPNQDEFKFQASVREVTAQHTYDFRITFIDLELKETKRVPINFTNVAEVSVTGQNLKFQTNPLTTTLNKIAFTVTTGPRYGNLFLSSRKLETGDTFTQEDIDSGKLKYRLFKRAYSTILDEFAFKVSAPQCIDLHSILKFRHYLSKNVKPLDSLETLRVDEGSRVPLRILRTNPRDYGVTSLIYNLTIVPHHGWLTVTNSSKSHSRNNTFYFTSEELSSQKVYYVHDDSETREDSFQFVAIASDAVDFMYVGLFRIEITMKNDNAPERVVHKVFHVVSKGERLLTNKDLAYIDKDIDTKPNELIYTRRDTQKNGIYRVTNPTSQVHEFSQQDIDDNQILFKHQGDDHGKFEFGVTDGHFYTAGVLEIQASPPYVRLRESNGSVVQFNRSVALRPNELDVETNVYTSDKDIKYTVLEKPKHGVLLKHGRETNSFNKENLRYGIVLYKHLGGSLAKDGFKFKVSTKGAEAEGIFLIKIYPESYWQPLIVQNNKTVFVEEATSILLSKKSLEIMHPKIADSEIVYYLKEWPQNGYLELQIHDEHSDETREDYIGNAVKFFDQSMINEGRVFYVQSVMNQTNDKFVVDVTNGITWLRDLSVNFVIVPEKLYVETKGVVVIEGKSTILDETNFSILTPYYSGKVTDYRILEKPKHGVILESTKNSQVKKFSQKHLTGGIILYKHNGDESSRDSFKMVLVAGDKTSEPFDVWVTVQPVNDEVPVLVNRTKLTVWQGGSIALTPDKLAAVDNDTTARDITFNISGVRNGLISLKSSPELDLYNFTQQQIDESKIIFTHTNGSDAEFNFVLYDGVHTTESYTILIATKPVRLAIEQNAALNVFPLTRKMLSNKLLLTKCSDETREIKYTVRNGPHLGKIIMETSEGAWLNVERFTQRDINNSKVFYEHTKQFMDLTANDSFTFDVEAHFAESLTNQMFQIDISVSSGGLDRYVSVKNVRVEEGGSAQVIMNISGIVSFLQTHAGIENPAVLSRLVSQPSHGHVMILPDLNVTTFSQPQIEGGKIAYYHDHSDTLEDRINFSLYLTPGHILLCNTSIPVIIEPVNDEPFKLITNAPSITVVQNQNQTITRENLLTTDPDTPPEEIAYDVISRPTYGRLLLLPFNENISEVRQVNKFTQHDVDSNRLVYEHNGPLQAASFYFRVWDGRFNPTYTVFNVYVLPIKLNVTVPGPVNLQQGSNVALISESNVKLDTNARQDLVIYEVTAIPKYGVLYVRDGAAASFKQTDLLSKSVMFMQTDMTVSNDSLELTARLSGFEQKRIRIEIKIVPLMIMNPMIALAGEKTRITLQYMDATPLAKLTSSNPIYTIMKKPKFGKIKRIIRSSSSSGEKRGTREKEVTKFSHQEVMSGVIYMVCRKIPTMEYEGVIDSFVFILAASIFQPAVGEFEFRVKLDMDDYNMTLGGPMDPVGHEGEMAIAPNMSNDYLLILGMLLGVFLLGVVVIITIRCRHNKYKHAEEEKPEPTPAVGVMPLPRPPDHLMPVTPHVKRYANDHNSVAASTPLPVLPTMTSTLPQCKVIPLSPLESITGSEVDVSAKYPYGVADGDEWSSFDTSDLPCQSATTQRTNNPLLRRNQYWV